LYADGRIQWSRTFSFYDENTKALAGYNIGENYVTIPGSRTSRIINIDRTSNINVPGVWMFDLTSGTGIWKFAYSPVTTINIYKGWEQSAREETDLKLDGWNPVYWAGWPYIVADIQQKSHKTCLANE